MRLLPRGSHLKCLTMSRLRKALYPAVRPPGRQRAGLADPRGRQAARRSSSPWPAAAPRQTPSAWRACTTRKPGSGRLVRGALPGWAWPGSRTTLVTNSSPYLVRCNVAPPANVDSYSQPNKPTTDARRHGGTEKIRRKPKTSEDKKKQPTHEEKSEGLRRQGKPSLQNISFAGRHRSRFSPCLRVSVAGFCFGFAGFPITRSPDFVGLRNFANQRNQVSSGRFGYDTANAYFFRFNRQLFSAVQRIDEHGDALLCLANLSRGRNAVHHRHGKVEDDHIRLELISL